MRGQIRTMAVLSGAFLLLSAPAFAVHPLSAVHPPAVGRVGSVKVSYTRDIQPIFKADCYQCHGPDMQQASLRLDSRSIALAPGGVINPGKSASSRLMQRILGAGGKPRMPLGFAPLSPAQTKLIRTWIDQGAPWPADAASKKHWAYIKPVRPALPAVKDRAWVRNPIDTFVLARLEKEGLHPMPEAPRAILLRRVSLDLVGLPPSVHDLDAFLADKSPNAYEKAVDRLLASPRFGERWARVWLDLARYADTNGYEKDNRRSMWPYRDWVINAYNRDMPFDEFTIDQIAGDMLPNATPDQKIASGFNRNTMYNEEGGVDREEQRWLTIVDRVGTTASVWLGTTLACAQCHNHKYDPFTQKEFYQFFAFFNNADEPDFKVYTPQQTAERQALTAEMASLQRLMDAHKGAPTATPAITRAASNVSPAPRTGSLAKTAAAGNESPDPNFVYAKARAADLQKQIDAIDSTVATTLIMQERPGAARPSTYLRIKGSYLNKGDEVYAGTPAVLPPLPAGRPANRLGLAYWLADPNNPLVARVAVNRLWEQCFGRGIVETSEDFGTQGDPPSHPKLLDWLATEFVRQKWSRKAILRLIVTSATYRQSSKTTPALTEKDPYNRLFARGPRFRMEAEMIRDTALSAGGLLSLKMGGPSVFPVQPPGIWDMPYSSDQWVTSSGEDRYRRGIYTFWRRTSPYPEFVTFDAPSREYCTVRRIRTNTPLQALTTLNDPAFFDAARGLARRVKVDTGTGASPAAKPSDVKREMIYGFRLCAARYPTPREVNRLTALYFEELKHFESDSAAAKTVSMASGPDAPDLAALTIVSNVLLNLDETLTKE